ncbi:ABC transporter ATP-binding protein [Acidaminobacter sp. JC074]|uniref:ABC transporter ATP-binding protein n=1 Tax=Acidaminobacter sp. JC074 TaxID=2530199 RepID=UPI001F0D3F0B|nr:ABC transporter ATP-binding protein [Acidaminobacter sp. JC074]MCH4887219.1 ABC transporter ATP-binding protein [Acidaminobacter sp. JC074]
MVEVKDLEKIFKLSRRQMKKDKTTTSRKVAVGGISFSAKPGQIFGLLGPNGAGKTTTLRCISTLIKPTNGEIFVMGMDNQKKSSDVRGKLAFLTNELKLDNHFTASDTIQYFGELHNMTQSDIKLRRDELFNYFGITEFRDRKISEFSTGMKQKLSIAVSLIHDPDVVIFDEPTNGLDIITARAVTDYLMKLRDEGKVVIVSTHIMTVAEKLCDQIGIIIDGKLIINGTLDEILSSSNTENLEDAFFKYYSEVRGV